MEKQNKTNHAYGKTQDKTHANGQKYKTTKKTST